MEHNHQREHQRHSTRLEGYDYSQAGGYFVTICAKDRHRIFGNISNGRMDSSEIGHVVAGCWEEIPRHFAGVRCDVFQVMPNHVHGIIDLPERPRTPVGPRHAVSLQRPRLEGFGKPVPGSLSTIIRSFKSAATKRVHDASLFPGPFWQSRFHDRIIRDQVERFFIEQYIKLNPLLWFLKAHNASPYPFSIDQLRNVLEEEHGLSGPIVEWLIERGFQH